MGVPRWYPRGTNGYSLGTDGVLKGLGGNHGVLTGTLGVLTGTLGHQLDSKSFSRASRDALGGCWGWWCFEVY
jgi:hypothetical protein